jgi:hypothetical protein
MPRGNPRRNVALRLLPELIDGVRATGASLNRTVEVALAQWLAREQRRQERIRTRLQSQPSPPGGAA